MDGVVLAWPEPLPRTIFSAKRVTAAGGKSCYVVCENADAGCKLSTFHKFEDGWRHVAGDHGLDLAALLAEHSILRQVRTDEVWSFTVDEDHVDQVIGQLRVVDTGLPPSGENETDGWLGEVVEVPDGRLLEPRCEVNGHSLVAFAIGGTDQPAPAAVYDEYDEQFRPVVALATSSWFSESGGAPVSWDGGNRLEQLPGRLLLETQWGDNGHRQQVVRVGALESDLIDHIASWVGSVGASLSAALRLEPLLLPASAAPEEVSAWAERLEVELNFSLELPQKQVDAVRRRLRHVDATYRAVTEALAHPTGLHGSPVAAALDDALDNGVLGTIDAATDS